jgi:adenine-specific DNA-methyltransferase
MSSSELSGAGATSANESQDQPKPASVVSARRSARAELIWEGKYDANDRRVAPLRIALPFQTVETVNESTQDRQRNLFAPGFREEEWRNRLIWGDKKYVLPSLLSEFAGKVNLIYIDPPFDTGTDFSFTATVPDDPGSEEEDSFTFTKQPSIIEHKAYRDTWGRGLESYLQWFYQTALVLHELLSENGSIYVHLDWHVSSCARVILDEIFGSERFMNEIIWKRQTAKGDVTQGARHMGRIHDSIFIYTKSQDYAWNMQYVPYDQKYIESHYNNVEPGTGRRFRWDNLTAPGGAAKGNPSYEFLGVKRFWRYTRENMEELYKAGRIALPKPGGVPAYKRYLDEMPGVPIQDVWTDINPINSQAIEAVGYATQKPEALLERILRISSNENDLVLDCFCGSGTTAAVAENLRRQWIACDLGRFAIHTTRKRLLSIPDIRPFVVQNLGKYERQMWAGAEFGDGNGAQAAGRQRAYIEFILKLANATSIHGYTWLHGVKGGRLVHVGAVDAPVSVGDVTQIAAEFKRAVGTGKDAPKTNGVDVLGWNFAFELNEIAKQQAAAANIQMRFLRIPRDVMDKRAVEQGDIHFFELAALSVEIKTKKRNVVLKLKDFVIPPDDVPEEARKAVKHWSQWIDYWAVDWDNKGDAFHNEWQTYRTRKDKSLRLEITNTYAEPGTYTIVVKVIDILGNDTTKSVRVRVD